MREVIVERSSSIVNLSSKALREIFFEENYASDMKANSNSDGSNSLFAISGQCNFSGAKTPLHWVEMAQNGILNNGYYYFQQWKLVHPNASHVIFN